MKHNCSRIRQVSFPIHVYNIVDQNGSVDRIEISAAGLDRIGLANAWIGTALLWIGTLKISNYSGSSDPEAHKRKVNKSFK